MNVSVSGEIRNPITRGGTRVPFQWSTIEEEAYKALKVMLSHAPVVQPPDWSQPFHIFVDVSDMAIGNALMQRTPPN